MKRHFLTGLKAFAVSALALAAVSCYDDSELWGELEGLEQRVAALEEKLNSEVATLNSKIGAVETAYKAADADLLKKLNDLDAKLVAELGKLAADLDAADGSLDGLVTTDDLAAEIKKLTDAANAKYAELAGVDKEILAALTKVAVTKVEKNAAGNAVLTFLDGTTLEVGAADANANNTGLVTVVDGKWAIIGADGKTTVLDAEVHPDTELKFKVDPDTNELLVSYDGKTWEQTGVIVNDDTTINVVTGFKEAADYVTITVGDREYLLPKYVADNSELTLGREKAFMTYGATKTLELKAEGIKEYYVMSKPDGWKASIEGTVLSVTAPSEELTELGAGELKGEILIHATADNGNCKVAKLAVETGDLLSIKYENNMLTIFNASTYEEAMEDGTTGKSFKQVWSGIVSLDDFRSFDDINSFYDAIWDSFICTNLFQMAHNDPNNPYEIQYYSEGVQEEQELTISLADVAKYLDVELDDETVYVAYSFYAGYTVEYETARHLVLGDFVSISFDNETYNDVDIVMESSEGSFIVGATSKTFLDNLAVQYSMPEFTLDTYMQMGTGGPDGGPWMSFAYGETSALGTIYNGTENNFKLSDILVEYGAKVEAENEYYVWVLPYTADRPNEDYQLTELKRFVCETAPLTLNESIVASSISATGNFYSITYSFTPPAGAETYYGVFTQEDWNGYSTEQAKVSALKQECPYPTNEAVENESETYGIQPETKYVLVTYSVKGGECGPLTVNVVETPEIPYDKDSSISVELESVKIDGNNYVVTLNVTGATSVMGYNIAYKESSNSAYLKNILSKPGTYPSYLWQDVSDGKVTFTVPYYKSKTDFVAWPYTATDGSVTELTEIPFVVKNLAEILTVDKKQWVFECEALDYLAFFDPDAPEAELPTSDHVFDLGVSYSPEYKEEQLEVASWAVATDWKSVYPEWFEEGESGWTSDINGTSAYTITSSNLSSGNISVVASDGETYTIPYSNFTGTTCTFDLTSIIKALYIGYGYQTEAETLEVVVNASLSESLIDIPML